MYCFVLMKKTGEMLRSMKSGNWNLKLAAANKFKNWLSTTANNNVGTAISANETDADPRRNAAKISKTNKKG